MTRIEKRMVELDDELEAVRNRIAFHQQRLLLTPSDCANQEVWEDVELSQIKKLKARENAIRTELLRLPGQSEFTFSRG